MLTFNKFIQLNEGSSDYSITHLEDLDVETFIRAISDLDELEAVQKLDGANLRAGLDEKNQLYASREQKGGKRFYKQADFPKTSAYDGFRAAFEVLKQREECIKDVLIAGEAINLEIIYGVQPNTVFYGKDGLNYIALLEMVNGDDPSLMPDQSKIKKLYKSLNKDGVVHVKTMASDTVDGKTLARSPKVTDWRFVMSDPVLDHKNINLEAEAEKLRKFLIQPNKVAYKFGKDLNNFEVIKDRSSDLADERKLLNDKLYKEYKLPIKNKLLKLVNKQKPSLRGGIDDVGAYHGIEGIIFTNPTTREKFKVVDRDVFTKINQFNYQVRKGIATRPLTTNPDQPKESRGGIVGEAKIRSINLFGLSNADLPNQAKKVLEKFKGTSRTETVNNISDSLNSLNFQAIKRKIQSIYVSALNDLEESLDTFKIHADEYSLKLDDGTEIKYTKEIKRRTLLSFAEAQRELFEMLVKVRRAQDMNELIEVFFYRQLDALHGAVK